MEKEQAVLQNKTEDDKDESRIEGCPTDSLVISVDKDSSVPDDDEERGHWGTMFEFFLAIVGYTVGVGSFWRFPIICSRNGGGAFLIPFYFLLISSGGPLYYLEVCLGQFSGQSAGLAFGFCPLLKGLGLLQVTLSITVLWCLMLICVWVYYFLYSSFSSQLPWAACGHPWNTNSCRVYDEPSRKMTVENISPYNSTAQNTLTIAIPEEKFQSAAFEFWEYQVIGRSSGLGDMGHLQPHAIICLLVAWTLTVLAVINGAKTLGKVVYVTATLPFLFLIIMFFRGITLDGALDGIVFYLTPDFSKLLTTQVIGRSSGLGDMGHLQPHAVICLLVAWTLTVLAVINGAKTLGKVVYVTATLPFLFLIIMFFRGITLDGALDGIVFYLTPDFSKLLTTQVIGRSSGLGDMGHLQPHAVICLLVAWTLTVLAVINGAKTLGKVVYVTATLPFLFLIIMFFRGITLDGALDGIVFYLTPDFSKLLTTQMWLEAGVQVFYSLGPTWGGVITMASYNKFHQKSFWSSTGCVMISGFSSFFNGLVVFTILGFMAKDAGLSVQEVATQSGPGLTFVVFPVALSKMPFPQLWSVLFFLMLATVVFDSLFGMLETITSGIIDYFPKYLTSRRIIVNIAVGVFMFITGLPLCLNSGIYVFQLGDWYFSQFALLFGSFFECIAVCWIYGTDRFARDIALMTGRSVSPLLRIMWSVVIPVFVLITFLIMLSRYSPPAYGDGYVYSSAALAVGIAVGLLPNIVMTAITVMTFVKADGTLTQRFRACSTPDNTWQPNNRTARKIYQMKPYVYPSSFKERVLLNFYGPKHDYVFDLKDTQQSEQHAATRHSLV